MKHFSAIIILAIALSVSLVSSATTKKPKPGSSSASSESGCQTDSSSPDGTPASTPASSATCSRSQITFSKAISGNPLHSLDATYSGPTTAAGKPPQAVHLVGICQDTVQPDSNVYLFLNNQKYVLPYETGKVTAVFTCTNGQWTYTAKGVTTVVTEVSCAGLPKNTFASTPSG